jgi:ABC-type transporter Mla maintaining outer membrane lipid asymmetry ATPase subunit MlaF
MESAAHQSSPVVILMKNVAVGSMQDPTTAVLTSVSWEVHHGDFWVLAGLQGEGKSDFLMMTAGLMAPLEGQYQLLGETMPMFDEARLSQRLRLGLVFETGQLLNQLTVSENLALPIRYHRNLSKAESASEVQAMLERMELGPWADSTPGALARNWHKRVGLARALMLKPEILLMDNPLAGLDPRHVYWWLDVLGQLSKRDNFVSEQPVTLIVTTADLQPWVGLGRQFAIFRKKQMTMLGDRLGLQAAEHELIGELFAPEARNS